MRKMLIAGAVCLILGGALSTGAFAKGKPVSEAAQNLSVPAILVGPLAAVTTCGTSASAPSPLVQPTGIPLSGYELPGEWWVQKTHVWLAQCFNAASAEVLGSWGDNLTGDASLKAGSPIRVEIVLTNTTDYSTTLPNMQGYNVLKLQPSTLDRLSAYGHDAVLDGTLWVATPDSFVPAQWVVHDSGMQFSVQNVATGAFVVPLGPIAPEINATGKIVYGYNLTVTAAGKYLIRFQTTPAVTFTGVDAGTYDANSASLEITVNAGGGGGGGRRP